jgi:hypothetical protein
LKNLKPWALDSGDNETTAKIKTESVFWTGFVIVNLGLALIAAILFIVPVRNDEDAFFPLYLFDRYFSEYAYILNWVYRSTFFIVAFTMVNCAHLFLYIVEHIIFQTNLLVTHMANIPMCLSTTARMKVLCLKMNTTKWKLKIELNFV